MRAVHLLLLPLLLLAAALSEGKKVLLIPAATPSHLLQLGGCGDGIIKRGHQAYMIVHQGMTVPSSIVQSGVKLIRYKTDQETVAMETAEAQLRTFEISRSGNIYKMMTDLLSKLEPEVKNIVLDQELMNRLREEKFDFALVDGSDLTKPYFVIPYRLGIPYGSVAPFMPLSLFSVSMQIPYLTPLPLFPFSLSSTFSERFLKVIAAVIFTNVIGRTYDEEMFKKSCEKPFTSLDDINHNASFWLLDLNDLVDVPKPSPPNMFNIGGLSVTPGKQLPPQFKRFADDATEGLIVMTFGGTLGYLPEDYIDKIIQGVAKVKFKVVWSLKNKPGVKVPNNLKIVDWMPQNDLLAHPNTKLFITHCGSNGQHEAVYHGVPMLGLPVCCDQQYNAERFTAKGYGKYLDIITFKPQELTDAINEVIGNRKYRNNIQRMSKIFKSRPMLPREIAAFWVDQVMEHGDEHLKSYTSQLRWYEILMLDVVAAFIILGLAVLFVAYVTCRCVYRRCFRKANEKQKTQ